MDECESDTDDWVSITQIQSIHATVELRNAKPNLHGEDQNTTSWSVIQVIYFIFHLVICNIIVVPSHPIPVGVSEHSEDNFS